MNEREIRDAMVSLSASLFNRGYAAGGVGNISARLPDECILTTPADSSLGRLEAASLAKVALDGTVVSGEAPSEDVYFHLAVYGRDAGCGAVVHLHSAYLMSLSCLEKEHGTDSSQHFPPYYVMQTGHLPLLPYLDPEDPDFLAALEKNLENSRAFLLENHGALVLGRDIVEAVSCAEELEEAARLLFLLENKEVRHSPEGEVGGFRF